MEINGLWIVVAFLSGTVMAHTIKFCLAYKNGERGAQLRSSLSRSGGMPSGHSASITAAATYTGMALGWTSVPFAVLLCVAIEVMYDAVNVRYAVGEQGKVVNKILRKVGSDQEMVKIVKGHTKKEMLAGLGLGIVMGLVVFWLVNGF